MHEFEVWAAGIQEEADEAEDRLKLYHSQDVVDRDLARALEGETVTQTASRAEKLAKSAATRFEKGPNYTCEYEGDSLIRCWSNEVDAATAFGHLTQRVQKTDCACG